MIEEFKKYILSESLFSDNDRVILAVSGGIDSVVMTTLFSYAGFNFGIAHCNFNLRGKDSDLDEEFVREIAEKFNIPFYVKQFDTQKYSNEKSVSIQMAARELRYKWFNELLKKENYKYIATAHHRDDSIETFFINLIRGTGISGLHGILPGQGNLVRPLLFAGKEEIEKFQKENNIRFREDKSNLSDKYLRNRIRHNLLPQLKEINPDFGNVMYDNICRFTDSEEIYFKEINKIKEKILVKDHEKLLISIEELLKLKPLKTYLYELLHPFNFSFSDVNNIINSLKGIPGKQFYSSTHRLLKDRKSLIITPLYKVEEQAFFIDKNETEIFYPINLKFSVEKNIKIPSDNNIASLDYSKLKFPLKIRRWKTADTFIPLGMNGRKKLSDFFIDQKFSILDKEKLWLLCSGNDIVWIVGNRIDNRFRITNKTKQIFRITII